MINGWSGLLFPLWLALLFEPTQEHKKTTEPTLKVKKIKKEQSQTDTTLVIKIKN